MSAPRGHSYTDEGSEMLRLATDATLQAQGAEDPAWAEYLGDVADWCEAKSRELAGGPEAPPRPSIAKIASRIKIKSVPSVSAAEIREAGERG